MNKLNLSFLKNLQLKDTEQKALEKALELVYVKEAETILKEGTLGTDLFFLLEGKVKIVKEMLPPAIASKIPFLKENTKTLAILEGKDTPMLGELALIDTDQRSASVIALSPCTLLKLSQKKFLELAKEHPELGFKLLYQVSKNIVSKLRVANESITKLTIALALLLKQKST